MKEFIFLFRGGKTSSASEAELDAHETAWDDWMDDMDKKEILIDGRPMRETALVVNSDGITQHELSGDQDVSGYLILEAEDMDAAAELAGRCPIFQFGGSVEIRELFSDLDE